MIWPPLQTISEIVIGRVLNSLPEGVLIALFTRMILRFLPRQNSGTRFAVWFVALLAIAGLPLIGGVTGGPSLLTAGSGRHLITVPGPWAMIVFLAWILAASVAMLRLAVGLWQLRVLRTSCIEVDGKEFEPGKRQLVADFISTRSVTLATSERVTVPTAIGFFQPAIVFPVWALQELTPAELNIVLLHEFAHLRRGDAWTNLLQKIVRAVFVFHPAVWWIERRLSLEREMACDDQVLAETANPHGYAKCLVALLEKSVARRGLAMAQAVVHRAREAALRLAQILDDGRPDTRSVCKPALGLVGAFSMLCLVIGPRTPQFVSFEPVQRTIQADNGHAALLSQPQPAMIPAGVRTVPSSPLKKIPQAPVVQAIGHLHEGRPAVPHVIAARWSTDGERTNQNVMPALLVIRTTQQVGPNTWMWSVDVWRVNVVNSARDEARPVAKKT